MCIRDRDTTRGVAGLLLSPLDRARLRGVLARSVERAGRGTASHGALAPARAPEGPRVGVGE
eukprot:2912317-Lingulodinium_polyedra.AAC.1